MLSNDDSIAKQAPQRTLQGHRGRGQSENIWRKKCEQQGSSTLEGLSRVK